MVAASLLFQWYPSPAWRNSRGAVHETVSDLHDADLMDKRTLRRHGYPPDKQEKATRTVLEQAEVLSADWAV